MERDFTPFLDKWQKYLDSLSNEEFFGLIGLTPEEVVELAKNNKNKENHYFACQDCPICEEFEHRKKIAKELQTKVQYDHCSCDKVGLPFFSGGYCEDAWENVHRKVDSPRKKRNKGYYRYMNRKSKEKQKRKEKNKKKYFSMWLDESGSYIKRPRDSYNSKFYRKIANRKARREKMTYGNHGQYRKCYDYKWAVG